MPTPILTRRWLLQGGVAVAGLGVLAGGGLLALRTQQPKVTRLGFLGPTVAAPQDDALPQALQELGYFGGRNLEIIYRRAEHRLERLPDLAAELVRLGVDVILSAGNNATRAAMGATSTLPIVMVFSADPVASGLVESLARPGGNVTGLTTLSSVLGSKRLGLLAETVPGLARVAILTNPGNPSQLPQLRDLERAAQSLNLHLQLLETRQATDLAGAFEAAARERAQAILAMEDGLFLASLPELLDISVRIRLPTMYANGAIVRAGGLMSYGPDFTDQYRRAAAMIDRILRGAKPADLPVELPSRFDCLVNLKAARAIGLTVPDSILAQATEILE